MRPEDRDSRLPAIPEWQEQPLGPAPQVFRGAGNPHNEISYAEQAGSKTIHDYLHAFLQRKWLLTVFLAVGL